MAAPGSDYAYPEDMHAARDGGASSPLVPPDTPRFLGEGSPSLQDSARNSFVAPTTPDASRPFLTGGASEEKFVEGSSARPRARRRWPLFVLAGAIAVVVIVLAVVLPVTLVHKHHSSGSGASAASPTSNPESPTGLLTGGNGSLITTEDGITFTYVNNFGGICEYQQSLHF